MSITSIPELRSSVHVHFNVVFVRVLRGGACELWGDVVPVVLSCICKRWKQIIGEAKSKRSDMKSC